jgi:hypothetical protein
MKLPALILAASLLLTGCTSITYTRPDGTRFHYYSTKDVSFDRVALDKIGAIEGAAANASEARKEQAKAVEAVAGAVSDAAKVFTPLP